MKKLVPVLLFSIIGTAHAGSINCDTPVFVGGQYVGYEEKADFPNSPKTVSYDAWSLKKPTDVCGISFIPKGNTLTVKAEKLEYFGYITTQGRQSNNAMIGALINRPTGKKGIVVTVNFDPYYTTRKIDVDVPSDLIKTSVVAARVDGGKLQPLYWPGVGFSTIEFPKSTKVVDVYIKTNQPANWQRMTFTLQPTPTLTLYRKFTFPTK